MRKPEIVKRNIDLSLFTSFKIGGPAQYFAKVSKLEEIFEVLLWAKEKNLSYYILGGGTNILIPDKGIDGLVIKNSYNFKKRENSSVLVGSGCQLAEILNFSYLNNLSGLEWAAGIPGTVGGAIRSNAGAYGKSISQVLGRITFLDFNPPCFEVKHIFPQDCQFGYRKSLFQEKPWIIWQAQLKLKRVEKKNEIFQRIEKYRKKRKNQPKAPSAGCIFKNIEIKDIGQRSLEKIEKEFPEVRQFYKKGIIPAGWLIEKMGLKGRTIGRAQISPEHANFIINLGGATADNVLTLISIIKQKARNEFNIQLQEEINILNWGQTPQRGG